RRLGGPVVAADPPGELLCGVGRAAPDVEHAADGALVRQHENIRVDDVVDVDVVPDRLTVLVERRCASEQVVQVENAACPRVGVVYGLPGTLHDAVAKGDGRNAVALAKIERHHLLAV